MGAGAVGKTCTTIRLVANEYRPDWDPCIEDTYPHFMEVDGKKQELDINDTAGQDEFSVLLHHWIRESDAFVMIYSIISQRTFQHAIDEMKTIWRIKEAERVDMVLIGNKVDRDCYGERQVRYEDGKELADKYNIPFIEASAKTGDNVIEAFELLVRKAREPDVTDTTDDANNRLGECCNGCAIM